MVAGKILLRNDLINGDKSSIILYDIKWIRLGGQVVKTPPSHGGIRGSIPLRAILNERRYAFVLFMA